MIDTTKIIFKKAESNINKIAEGLKSHGKLEEKIKNASANGIGYPVSDAIKRRPVIWIKEISREEFPPKLAWILTTHQTILSLELSN